jgi:two-component sensor histidine kinase
VHGLLTAADWRGASLRDLVAAELAPYEGRVTVGGPEVMLPPNAALSLALALHELATNALKYGALSVPEGRVEVRWSLEGGRLQLAWREGGGPLVAPPARRGFGSLLVERSVAHNLGGTARLEFRPEGLAYEVELPLEPG